MNDLNIPSDGKEKICSCCLRRLPLKYFLKDTSRSDNLACNCNSCLFPNGKYYRAKFPELYELDRFPKIDPMDVPVIARQTKASEAGAKGRAEARKRLNQERFVHTFKQEGEESVNTAEQLKLVN